MLSPNAPLAEKLAQLDEDAHVLLHDITCCWLWLRERLQRAFPNEVVDRYDDLFMKGLLGYDSGIDSVQARYKTRHTLAKF